MLQVIQWAKIVEPENPNAAYLERPPRDLPNTGERPREILLEIVGSRTIHGHTALDLCCGKGINSIYLAREHYEVTGLDRSAEEVKEAVERSEELSHRVRFVRGEQTSLPFVDDAFDLVFDEGCYRRSGHGNGPEYIREVHRVLKKKGWYLFNALGSRNDPSPQNFTRAQIKETFHPLFEVKKIDQYSTLEEGEGVRYFFSVLMQKG